MKIIISNTEFTRLQITLESINSGMCKEFLAGLKDTHAISYKLHPTTKEVEVIIEEEYIKDACDVYQKYLGIIFSNLKSIIMTCELFAQEANAVDQKYAVKHEEKSDENAGA